MLAHIFFFSRFAFPTSLKLCPVYQLGSPVGDHRSKLILLEFKSSTLNIYANLAYIFGNVLLLLCVREHSLLSCCYLVVKLTIFSFAFSGMGRTFKRQWKWYTRHHHVVYIPHTPLLFAVIYSSGKALTRSKNVSILRNVIWRKK
jgi:hypothetical protein